MLFITKNINKKHIIFFFSFKGISYSHKIKSSSSSSTARVVVPTTTTIFFHPIIIVDTNLSFNCLHLFRER